MTPLSSSLLGFSLTFIAHSLMMVCVLKFAHMLSISLLGTSCSTGERQLQLGAFHCEIGRFESCSAVKVMGTSSRIRLVCHKLACITFHAKKLLDIYNNQSLQRAFGYSSA